MKRKHTAAQGRFVFIFIYIYVYIEYGLRTGEEGRQRKKEGASKIHICVLFEYHDKYECFLVKPPPVRTLGENKKASRSRQRCHYLNVLSFGEVIRRDINADSCFHMRGQAAAGSQGLNFSSLNKGALCIRVARARAHTHLKCSFMHMHPLC